MQGYLICYVRKYRQDVVETGNIEFRKQSDIASLSFHVHTKNLQYTLTSVVVIFLSHDFTSGSKITSCIKIKKKQ